jgi:hypothetical protein
MVEALLRELRAHSWDTGRKARPSSRPLRLSQCCYRSHLSLFLTLGLNVVGANWVVGSAFAAIIFGGAAFARFVEDRKTPAFHLIADIKRSLWVRAPRSDGNSGLHSQIVLHFRVTNNTRGPLLLSAAKPVRPRLWGAWLTNILSTLNALLDTYSPEN